MEKKETREKWHEKAIGVKWCVDEEGDGVVNDVKQKRNDYGNEKSEMCLAKAAATGMQ